MSKPPWRVLSVAALLALPAGCRDDDDDSGPTDQQVFLVQNSSAASGAVGQVVEAANAEIIGAAAPSFNLSASVDVVLDLDSADANGHDRFPNASGLVHVTASGTVNGTSQSGDASYSVAVAADADVLATHPDTGAQVVIPSGSSWSYQLDVAWTVTDSDNWALTAEAGAQIAVSDMTVIDGATVREIDIQGQRNDAATLSRTAGQLAFQRTVEGSLSISVDDGTNVETVVIVIDGAGLVTISVQGEVFGPMPESEARALFGAGII